MRRPFAVVLLVLCSVSPSVAQTPSTTRQIPYAGIALDDTGAAVAGEVTVTLELYEDQQGGAPLWRERQLVQADARGRFLVYLGAVRPLPQEAFAQERARWLGVTIARRALPRAMLVAVPYALRAADAEMLGGQPASSFVRTRADGRLETSAGVALPAVDGTGVPGQLTKWASPTFLSSSIITESATNRIGVGLTDPTGGGVVDSVFTIRNFDNNTGLAVLNQLQQRRFALNTLANGSWTMYDGVGGTWRAGLSQSGGIIGIGGITSNFRLNAVSDAPFNNGVLGFSDGSGIGVRGSSSSGTGVSGASINGTGVRGTTFTDTAVEGESFGTGLAGNFIGNVTVSGTLSKGGGSFKIDHPLDPMNKYLSHSFVESPDMMNVYNGNVRLDARGEAWITMPDWFEALNRDFRYQLTAIGAPGPNLYVAAKVSENRFKIAGGTPAGEVSWQVTGIRQDAWATAHRIAVEEDKPAAERGTYLHPKEHAKPESAAWLLNRPAPLQTGAQNSPQ